MNFVPGTKLDHSSWEYQQKKYCKSSDNVQHNNGEFTRQETPLYCIVFVCYTHLENLNKRYKKFK